MSEVIRGAELIGGPFIRVTGNPTTGRTVEYRYEGTMDAVRALANVLPAGSDFVLDENDPPKSTLVVRVQGVSEDQAVLSATFDLKANTQQKSLYEHPNSIALGNDTLLDIRKAIKKSTAFTGTGWAATLYARVLRGQDTYIVSQPVFRTTQMVRTRRQFNFAVGNLDRVYSDAQLIREANPYAPFIQGIQDFSAAMTADVYQGAPPAGYTVGWLKQSYEVTNVAGNRVAATLEYWLEAWPTSDSTYLLSTVI